MDLKEPQFTQAEVLEATGLEAATLQTWANRKIIVPASEHPGRSYGRGGRRLYSGEDVIALAIWKAAADIAEVGLAVDTCGFGEVRDGLRSNDGELPFVARVLLTAGHTGTRDVVSVAVESFEKFIEGARSCFEKGQPFFAIPTQAIERRTREKLEAIATRKEGAVV